MLQSQTADSRRNDPYANFSSKHLWSRIVDIKSRHGGGMYDANIHIFFGELMVIEPAKPLYRRV